MLVKRPSAIRRKRSSGGNTLVESVFTLLPTLALVFAFLDFSLMLMRWSTLENAVREGARYAITFQTQSGLGQTASIKNIVQSHAMGFVHVNDSPQHIFVKYYTTTDTVNPIGSGGNQPGNIVEVSVQNLTFNWMMPLSSTWAGNPLGRSPLTLSVYSSDILGGLPIGMSSVPE